MKNINNKYVESWKQGYDRGEHSVFEFLSERVSSIDINELREEYKAWANSDESSDLSSKEKQDD